MREEEGEAERGNEGKGWRGGAVIKEKREARTCEAGGDK